MFQASYRLHPCLDFKGADGYNGNDHRKHGRKSSRICMSDSWGGVVRSEYTSTASRGASNPKVSAAARAIDRDSLPRLEAFLPACILSERAKCTQHKDQHRRCRWMQTEMLQSYTSSRCTPTGLSNARILICRAVMPLNHFLLKVTGDQLFRSAYL